MADRKIIDAFLFDTELSLLAHRFAETFDLVDIYIIVEAGETLQGAPKPLAFADHRASFSQYSSKIKHVALPRLGNAATDPWERERVQRNALLFALTQTRDDDILLLLDADEIPSREVLQRLRAEGIDQPRRLLMTRHYESADLLAPLSPCCLTASKPFAFALGRKCPPAWDTLGITWFSRSGVALPLSAVLGPNKSQRQAPFDLRRSAPLAGALPNAGRHLCFVDPSASPARKLARVAHTELAGDLAQSRAHLTRCADYGVHHRGWWYAERPAGALPADLARLIEICPEIRCGKRLPPYFLRRVVRSWTWLRRWQKIPAKLVKAIDRRFWLWSPVLMPLLLILDLGRAVAAHLTSLPAHAPNEQRHFTG